MVCNLDTGVHTAAPARAPWVVSAAYVWVAGFALIHVCAIISNGEYGIGVDPGTGTSGFNCVWPNAVVIAICLVAAGTIHRTTSRPRPLVPAWTVFAGAWIGMPILVLRGAATAVDESLRVTGAMPYGLFDQRDDAMSAWAQWSGRVLDVYFMVGAIVLAMALGPWMKKSRRQAGSYPRDPVPVPASATGGSNDSGAEPETLKAA
jgi:hypothetical protein